MDYDSVIEEGTNYYFRLEGTGNSCRQWICVHHLIGVPHLVDVHCLDNRTGSSSADTTESRAGFRANL